MLYSPSQHPLNSTNHSQWPKTSHHATSQFKTTPQLNYSYSQSSYSSDQSSLQVSHPLLFYLTQPEQSYAKTYWKFQARLWTAEQVFQDLKFALHAAAAFSQLWQGRVCPGTIFKCFFGVDRLWFSGFLFRMQTNRDSYLRSYLRKLRWGLLFKESSIIYFIV